MAELSTAPHRVTRPGSIGPRALGPDMTVVECGPLRVVTPPKKSLVAKPGGTFPNQGLHTLGWNSSVDGAEGGTSCLH
jgi:hypothetical protein